MRWLERTLSLAVLLAASVAAGGCSRYGGFCADAMDCERGNDADLDACEIELNREEDQADTRGCAPEWDDYYACLEEASRCDNRVWNDRDNCKSARSNWLDCIK
jgi:hypothetical protein